MPADPIGAKPSSHRTTRDHYTVADLRELLDYLPRRERLRENPEQTAYEILAAKLTSVPSVVNRAAMHLETLIHTPHLTKAKADQLAAYRTIKNEARTRFGRPLDLDALAGMTADIARRFKLDLPDVDHMKLDQFVQHLVGGSHSPSVPPSVGTEKNEGGNANDAFAKLLTVIDASGLNRTEAKVVRVIAEKRGSVPIVDANTLCDCDALSAFKRAKPKLRKLGWVLRQHHSKLCIAPLKKSGQQKDR